MNRDLLFGGLVLAIVFLLGVEVLAESREEYSIQSPDEEIVIVLKHLPVSELRLAKAQDEESNSQREIATVRRAVDESEFKVDLHPLAGNQ